MGLGGCDYEFLQDSPGSMQWPGEAKLEAEAKKEEAEALQEAKQKLQGELATAERCRAGPGKTTPRPSIFVSPPLITSSPVVLAVLVLVFVVMGVVF